MLIAFGQLQLHQMQFYCQKFLEQNYACFSPSVLLEMCQILQKYFTLYALQDVHLSSIILGAYLLKKITDT